MTLVRAILLGCALMALLDGDVGQAIFIVLFVVVLVVAAPGGVWQRPVPFRVWWGPGGWRGR